MTDKPVCSYCGSSNRVARFKGGPLLCIKHYLQMYNQGELHEGHKSRNTNKVFTEGNTGKIITAKGEEILVDADDLPVLQNHSWCTLVSGGYVVANISGKITRMHRLITKANDDEVIDHINGNPLDNRKANLRVCTAKNNSRNKGISKNNTSGVPGVSRAPDGRFRARIMVDRKETCLGYFDDFQAAVQAREKAEQQYFGKYSRSLSRND